MGMADKFDELKDRGQDAVGGNADKAKDGVDTAADKVDEKTGGKAGSQVDRGSEAAKDRIDDLGQSS